MNMSSAAPTVNLPNGAEATFEDMQSYGRTLQAFIREQEKALRDIQDTRRHNQVIDFLHMLSDGYNEQLKSYNAAQARRQQALLVAIMLVAGGQGI
jgi:hypothetical protein